MAAVRSMDKTARQLIRALVAGILLLCLSRYANVWTYGSGAAIPSSYFGMTINGPLVAGL